MKFMQTFLNSTKPMRVLGFSRRHVFILIVALPVEIGGFGCKPAISRDEVARVSSPDGRLDAVLFETNGGATTSFGYKVEVGKKGSRNGTEGANLYGATRNPQAYGVNLRWTANEVLNVEYLTVKRIVSEHNDLVVNGSHVRIVLQSNVEDPSAPSGGMLYNLQRR